MNQLTEISIFCNNSNRTNHTTHSILQDLARPESKTSIIVITEPWIGTIRAETQEKGTVNHRDWTCLAPKNIEKANVTIYIRKDAPFRTTPFNHLSIASESVLPVQITTPGQPPFLLIGVYNSPSTNEAANLLQSTQLPPCPILLTGDFNLHSPDWDSTVIQNNEKAQDFIDWSTQNELEILNDPDRPTYHGHNYQYAKVDDLFIANLSLQTSFELTPVQVHDQDHFGSDHYPISLNILNLAGFPTPDPDYVLSEARKEDWTDAIGPKLNQLLLQATPNPDPESIDRMFSQLIDTITETTKQTIPARKGKSAHSKHWWNQDLSKTLGEIRKLSRTIRTSRNPYLIRQHHRTKNVFRAKVKHAKRTWATDRLEGATSHSIWGFIKWYKHSGKRYRPLYSSPANVPADDDHARAEIFVKEFFPEPPPTKDFTADNEPWETRQLHPLTQNELAQAILGSPKDTTPGPSRIGYTAIKWTWETSPDLMFYLYSHCLSLGHYPTPLKTSATAIVPKTKKKDYSVASSYRPIQLLECLGKVLDKITAKRIQFEVAHNNLVPHSQFGGRILSSTTDAGLALTHDIHQAWANKMKASALFFDISGFFNAVNHDILTHKLQHLGFDQNTIKLINSYLRERSTVITFDRFTSRPIPIPNGIPQGSPLSPILAIIYSADSLQIKRLIKLQMTSFAYMDDGVLLTSSPSLETNVTRLIPAYQILTEWLTDNGLRVQSNKVELMHFTKGPDPSSPPLCIPNTNPITAPKTIKWLGFHLDRHLNFTHHSKIMSAQAMATVNAMKILGNTVRGMSHVQLRQLTLTTIVPVLTYGCQLWWGGRFQKTNTARLQGALNQAMRLVCRAFKTTPIAALQHISHIPPLSATIHRLCYSSSIRLHRLLPESAVTQRIPHPTPSIRITHHRSNRTFRISTPKSRISPLRRIAQITNATSAPTLNPIVDPPWSPPFHEHPRLNLIKPPPIDDRPAYSQEISALVTGSTNDLSTLLVATDGSRRTVDRNKINNPHARRPRANTPNPLITSRRIRGPKHTGAGIVATHGPNKVFKQSYGVGKKSNAYDGECLGLAAGMKRALDYCTEHPEITQITLLSDSSTAITNITKTTTHSCQALSMLFIKHAKEFLLNDDHRITIRWIPGHQGHELNEKADRLAKKGCYLPQIILPTSISYHAEKRSRLVAKEWEDAVNAKPYTGAFSKITFNLPNTKPSQTFLNLEEKTEVFGRLTQIRTMHGYNVGYYDRFKIPYDPECLCNHLIPPDPITNVRDHIFHNCEAYDEHRHILLKFNRRIDPNRLLSSEKGMEAAAKFIEASGAFTSNGRPIQKPSSPELPGLDLSDPTQSQESDHG